MYQMYSRSNKKIKKKIGTSLFNFNTNNRREMKFIPINMDYCLLQFDALNFFLGVRLHGRSVSKIFSM